MSADFPDVVARYFAGYNRTDAAGAAQTLYRTRDRARSPPGPSRAGSRSPSGRQRPIKKYQYNGNWHLSPPRGRTARRWSPAAGPVISQAALSISNLLRARRRQDRVAGDPPVSEELQLAGLRALVTGAAHEDRRGGGGVAADGGRGGADRCPGRSQSNRRRG